MDETIVHIDAFGVWTMRPDDEVPVLRYCEVAKGQVGDSSRFPQGIERGAWGFPKVAGRCPSCGLESLFLAVGGHITCAVIGCKEPCLVDDWLHGEKQ